MAVQHWRAFLSLLNLQSTQTSSLVQLSDQRLHTTWQQKLFMKLLGLRYHIIMGLLCSCPYFDVQL